MRPAVAVTVQQAREALAAARGQGKLLGLVPTMGALHRGHTSLIDLARSECGFVVVSIFVNPIQFGPAEDYGRYPRPFEADLDQCAAASVDLVFAPTPEVMYPPGFRTFVEVADLEDVLCGASRPGHFRGVATVVLKLFTIVAPNRAYFGQKDAQQVRILQQMVRDLNVPVALVVGPTVREADGLALSSRNRYLDADQRRHAPVLFQALTEAKARIEAGEHDPEVVRRRFAERITATPGAVLDYAAVVDADTLRPPTRLTGPTLLAVAVRFGGTRLIDNLLIDVKD
jgi:pantoate--beta-alanine ligase